MKKQTNRFTEGVYRVSPGNKNHVWHRWEPKIYISTIIASWLNLRYHYGCGWVGNWKVLKLHISLLLLSALYDSRQVVIMIISA